jgi:8-oxo-dGTP pyrophosphatase MutT (NUDIX family)
MKPYKAFSTTMCINCSAYGHQSKQCPQPITSYGVILYRTVDETHQFLLIQRRDSIGFIEMMRGKYRVADHEYIKLHLAGMTAEERVKLRNIPFDALWESLWGVPHEGSHAYKHEKEQAKQKLEALYPVLDRLLEECGPAWATPEWGFPKGRRDINESEYGCAMREMWEETNISEKDICPFRNLDAIEENFVGTNNVSYCHRYYIAYAPAGVGEQALETIENNEHIRREVGAIQWFTLDEAIKHIRDVNPEKRDVLLRVNSILQTYYPLRLEAKPKRSP